MTDAATAEELVDGIVPEALVVLLVVLVLFVPLITGFLKRVELHGRVGFAI
jgi:hypothetical protein